MVAGSPDSCRVHRSGADGGQVMMTISPRCGCMACAFLIVILLSAGCIEPQQQREQVPGPDFRGETINYDDRVIFRFIPDTAEPATYSVTYTIEKGVPWGTTIESRDNATYEHISNDNPLEFVVDRQAGSDRVAIEIEIRNTEGEVLHRSRTSVKPGTPTPTLP
jgi:hypothetical protein